MKKIAITILVASGLSAHADPETHRPEALPKVAYTYTVSNALVDRQAWQDYQAARHQQQQERNEARRSSGGTYPGAVKIVGNSGCSATDLFNEKINRNKTASK